MLKVKWNTDWRVTNPSDSPLMEMVQGGSNESSKVTLPHDAMILEKRCNHKITVSTTVVDANGVTVAEDKTALSVYANVSDTCRQRISLNNPNLWDTDTPYLYTCRTQLMENDNIIDESTSTFGARTLSLNAIEGLKINGKKVNLRGACIHHDNGIIGACTLERAEARRCRQLKEAGFNSIRSAHHPMSKAMLDACDREGVLVLDELSDVWTRSKNHNDAANFFNEYWEEDVTRMVAKDFNHPSVIMYITGNEIQEAGTAKGAEQNRKISKKVRELDETRYTSTAFNGLLAAMDQMGQIMSDITGMTPEQMMAQASGEQGVSSGAGADEANSMQGIMRGPMADAFARNQIITDIIDEFCSGTDIVGLNYLTGRHILEHELNSNRIVLGTETFPVDIESLWEIVENNNHVIGDMTWTGYDYLGEAGIGIFYYDGRQGFMENWPSSVAYIGDIDIIGNRRPWICACGDSERNCSRRHQSNFIITRLCK